MRTYITDLPVGLIMTNHCILRYSSAFWFLSGVTETE